MLQDQRSDPTEVANVPEEVTGQPRKVVLGRISFRSTFSALQHRNFRLFLFGQAVSLTGTWMQNTAQGWLVYQLTGSKVLLGVVAAVASAPMLLFSVWGGALADRHSKRKIVVWTQCVLMCTALTLAVLAWTGWIQPWHIVLLSGIGGVAMAFDMPARQSFMVEMTSRDDLMNAISLNSSVVNGARIIGPSVAGLLMAQVGVASCFFLNGLSYTAVIAGLLMMRLPTFQRPVVRTSFWEHTADGFSYVWNHRRLRIILLLFAVVGVFGWSYAVLLPAFAIDLLKVEQEGYGVMLSANGLGALAGALTVATVGARINRRLLVFGGLAVFSGMLVLLSIAQSYWLVLACLTGAGWGMLLFFATTNTLLQTTASDEMRGRVMGIWALVFGGITPLGGLLAGALSQSLGLRLTVTMGALICATTGLLVWLRVVRRKEQVLRNAN